MASQSSKRIATGNSQTLKELHSISLLVNFLALISLFVLHRPESKWKFFVFSLPGFGCELALERSGRPLYSKDSATSLPKLLRSGEDIKGPGLFEYMFDCVYITWICDILMILLGSNKVWIIFLLIPVFLVYKITSVVKSFMGSKPSAQPVNSSGSATDKAAAEKSKRQTKLAERDQKQRRVHARRT